MDASPIQTAIDVVPPHTWGTTMFYSALGLLGAGIKVCGDLAEGKVVNKWAITATLLAGCAFGGTATQGIIDLLGVSYGMFAGAIAVLIGIMAIGFVNNALAGKIPLLNKFMGGKDDNRGA
jgi:hypothetical protein